MSNSLTFASVDLGGANYKYVVTENNFADSFPPPRVARRALSNRDGEATQGATFGAREGAVRGIVTAASRSALLTQQENIRQALALGQVGPQALSFDTHSGKSWQARVLGATWRETSNVTADLSITFHAAQPWPIATSETTGSDDAVVSSGTTLVEAVGGTQLTDGTFVFKDGGTGASSIQISNASTGESAVWAGSLGAGEWLRLKSAGQVAEVSDDSGSTWTPRPEALSATIPQLQGGEDNDITVTGLDGTTAVNYYAVG